MPPLLISLILTFLYYSFFSFSRLYPISSPFFIGMSYVLTIFTAPVFLTDGGGTWNCIWSCWDSVLWY